MSSYVSSSSISVFPSTKRGNTQRSARLLSESNLIGLVNKLLDTDSFVITNNVNSVAPTDVAFEFNLHGYYFKVESDFRAISGSEEFSSSNGIWAYIVLSTSDGYIELSGQDDGGVYKGVTFVADAPTPSINPPLYSLKILERDSTSSAWRIPDSSRIKYAGANISGTIAGTVDGGEI